MNSRINSVTIAGLTVNQVNVEVDIDKKTENAQFFIVGLPSASIMESRKRVTTALKNCIGSMPEKRIIVNLSPADLKKDGTWFDLAIALGILKACGSLSVSNKFLDETIILGELSLDGIINPIKGALTIASNAKKLNKKRIMLPKANELEAALIEDVEIIGVETLEQAIRYIEKQEKIQPAHIKVSEYIKTFQEETIDFDDVKGQEYAKRALQIAAAGRHNLIFSGPPGSGKTMLAKRIMTIMPDMNTQEIIQTTQIYSIAGKLNNQPIIAQRPFRSPHHTSTRVSLVGGGAIPKPGEITLAHNGVLFLDELTEFNRESLESLREPLENKCVYVSRVKQQIEYPASFLLVAAYNPCPCGFFGDVTKKCTCSPSIIKSYQNKLSGPLLDRIDIRIGVRAIEYHEATSIKVQTNYNSASMKKNVSNALEIQKKRFGVENKFNSMMNPQEIEQYCVLSQNAQDIIQKAFVKLNLSMRAYHKILKLSRTIADLSCQEFIHSQHLTEALMYKFEA